MDDMDCYNIRGEPISLMEWANLSSIAEYKIVEQTHLDGNKFWVSTVWLGLNHRFIEEGPPLIFETMVFTNDSWYDHYMERYSTLEAAQRGHDRIVQMVAIMEGLSTEYDPKD